MSNSAGVPSWSTGQNEWNEGSEPILCETLPGTTGDYIALSHCRGANQPLELIGPPVDRCWLLSQLSE
jgi:hypothetical protein